MKNSRLIPLAAVAALALTAPAGAEDYVFTKLADGDDVPALQDRQPTAFNKDVVVNRQGIALFTEVDSRGSRTYRADGLTISTIPIPRGALGATASSINDAGVISITANYRPVPDQNSNGDRDIPPFGIFTLHPGGMLNELVRVSGQDVGEGRPFSTVPINNADQVAWVQAPVTDIVGTILDNERIVRGAAVAVFDGIGMYERFLSIDHNDAGQIAFNARRLDQKFDILLADANSPAGITTIAATNGRFTSVGGVSLSDTGTVAFSASEAGIGDSGIFTGSGGAPVEIVDQVTSGFVLVASPTINDLDEVAFLAVAPGDGNLPGQSQWSIYTGPDTVNDRVIGPGDPLDGRTVDRVSFGNRALNDRGQIAFAVRFDDTEGGYYRADPTTLILPPGTLRSTFVPSRVTLRSGTLTASGTFDSGGLPLGFGGAPVVSVGGNAVPVQVNAGKKGPTTVLTGDGVELTLRTSADGGSKGTYKLEATGNATNGVDPDQPLVLALTTDSIDAVANVPLAGGKYKAKKTPPLGPAAYPMSVKAKRKGPGKDALNMKIALPGLGDRPGAAPDVCVTFGQDYEEMSPGGGFTPKGDKFMLKDGTKKIVLDYRKKTLAFKDKKIDLGAGTTAGQVVVAVITVGGNESILSFRVTSKKTTLKY